MANVAPPPVTYRPHLPHDLSEKGFLSAIQIERVIYAGQAHNQRLGSGARAGISIGDGTGAGKTATLAGIVLDNWFQNRRRTVWFSVKADLIEAVRDEFERLGYKIPVKLVNEFTPEQNILLGEGIVFCTYKSLIAIEMQLENLEASGLKIDLTNETKAGLLQALLGLTAGEISNVIAKAVISCKGLNADSIKVILEEKKNVIRGSGSLTYVHSEPANNFGGYKNLRAILERAAYTFSPQAKARRAV